MEVAGTPQLMAALFFLVTFFVGIISNSLYIWTLGFKMKKTVHTICILHLIIACWTFTILLPFFSVNVLMDFHWPFGIALCKLLGTLSLLCMYTSVWILMVISLDRYLFVMHPLWFRRYRSIKHAIAVCISMWMLAFIFSTPEFAFMDMYLDKRNRTICFNNFALSEDLESPTALEIKLRVQWSMFFLQLFFGFLLPFTVITFCYLAISMKMRLKKLTKSKKPFKVMVAAIVSFFTCWLPYHVYQGLAIYPQVFSKEVVDSVFMVAAIMSCVNVCFTPILYLFIGEHFKDVFKKSILTLIETAFHEDLESLGVSHDKTMELSVSVIYDRRVSCDELANICQAMPESTPQFPSVPLYSLAR